MEGMGTGKQWKGKASKFSISRALFYLEKEGQFCIINMETGNIFGNGVNLINHLEMGAFSNQRKKTN